MEKEISEIYLIENPLLWRFLVKIYGTEYGMLLDKRHINMLYGGLRFALCLENTQENKALMKTLYQIIEYIKENHEIKLKKV